MLLERYLFLLLDRPIFCMLSQHLYPFVSRYRTALSVHKPLGNPAVHETHITLAGSYSCLDVSGDRGFRPSVLFWLVHERLSSIMQLSTT